MTTISAERIVGLAVLLVGAVCFLMAAEHVPPAPAKLIIGPETTVLTGPLSEDGTLDYVEALNQRYGVGVTADNNAVIPMLKAIGPDCIQAEFRAQMLKKLGLADLPDKREYLVGNLPDTIPFAEREALRTRLLDAPVSAADKPVAAAWIKANEKPLALVMEASHRPHWFIPRVSNQTPPSLLDGLLAVQTFRVSRACHVLAGRAMLHAAEGRHDKASEDLLAVRRIATLMGRHPLLIEMLTARLAYSFAQRAETGLIRSGALPAEWAQKHLAAIQALPPIPGVEACCDSAERFADLDFLAFAAHAGLNKAVALADFWKDKPIALPEDRIDFNLAMRLTNARWDKVLQGARKPTFRQRQEFFDQWSREVSGKPAEEQFQHHLKAMFGDKRRSTWEENKDLFDKTAGKSVAEVTRAFVKLWEENAPATDWHVSLLLEEGGAYDRMVQVGLALRVYQAKNGRFPGKLAELAPAILKAVPVDPFVDKPMRYQRKGKGYLLYCLGANGKDDGGKGEIVGIIADGPQDDLSLTVE